jgi:hypothetical protein
LHSNAKQLTTAYPVAGYFVANALQIDTPLHAHHFRALVSVHFIAAPASE